MNQWMNMADGALMHTYNRFPLVLTKGEGVYLYDDEGKKYLDFGAGIAVFGLGYGNKKFNQAVKDQVDQIVHTSNLFYTIPLAKAASKLVKASGMDEVFFTNSGTEAIEGAVKLARKYAWQKHPGTKSEIIAMQHSFHGRSMGALSVTGNAHYQEAFKPLVGGVKFAEFNNLESVLSQMTDATCAVLLEPVQGEGGIFPAKKEFLEGVRKACDERDIVLIFDEIQCGMGRTGSMYAYEQYGVKPDILATAKALGNGLPVGAFAAVKKVGDAFEPGDHGTTYGGNPLACAAVDAVLTIFEEDRIVEHVQEVAPYMIEKLDALAAASDKIVERRGLGLMQGLELAVPVGPVVKEAMNRGLITMSAGGNVLRLVPPLVIEKEHVDEMIAILTQILG